MVCRFSKTFLSSLKAFHACSVIVDGFVKSDMQLRREEKKRSKRLAEEESRRFQPDDIDESRCCALIWVGASVRGVQCKNARLAGSDVCYVHNKKCERGKVRGLIPKDWLRK